jgi:hypothetical protein
VCEEIIGVVDDICVVIDEIMFFVNFGSNMEFKVKVLGSLELLGTDIGLVVVCIRLFVLYSVLETIGNDL